MRIQCAEIQQKKDRKFTHSSWKGIKIARGHVPSLWTLLIPFAGPTLKVSRAREMLWDSFMRELSYRGTLNLWWCGGYR